MVSFHGCRQGADGDVGGWSLIVRSMVSFHDCRQGADGDGRGRSWTIVDDHRTWVPQGTGGRKELVRGGLAGKSGHALLQHVHVHVHVPSWAGPEIVWAGCGCGCGCVRAPLWCVYLCVQKSSEVLPLRCSAADAAEAQGKACAEAACTLRVICLMAKGRSLPCAVCNPLGSVVSRVNTKSVFHQNS